MCEFPHGIRSYYFCPGCGHKLSNAVILGDKRPAKELLCSKCDPVLPTEEPKCPKCGEEIGCVWCGDVHTQTKAPCTEHICKKPASKPRTFQNLSEALAYFQAEYEAGRYKPPDDPLWDFLLSDWKTDGTSSYPKPSRLAELREKYRVNFCYDGEQHSHGDGTFHLCVRIDHVRDHVAVINELFDMLEKADAEHRHEMFISNGYNKELYDEKEQLKAALEAMKNPTFPIVATKLGLMHHQGYVFDVFSEQHREVVFDAATRRLYFRDSLTNKLEEFTITRKENQ